MQNLSLIKGPMADAHAVRWASLWTVLGLPKQSLHSSAAAGLGQASAATWLYVSYANQWQGFDEILTFKQLVHVHA